MSAISVSPTTAELTVGAIETITATVEPTNATNNTVTWRSNNANVATVDGGMVTAVAVGEATITAKAGNFEAATTVTVTLAEVTVSRLSKNYYTAGETLTFIISGLRANEEVKVGMPIFIGPEGNSWASDEEVISGMTGDSLERYFKGTTNANGELTVSGTVQADLSSGVLYITLPDYGINIDFAIELQGEQGVGVLVGDAAAQDNIDIGTAKTNIEAATYTATQAEVTDIASAKTKAQALVDALELAGATTVVVDGDFTAAIAGAVGSVDGTDGSYAFTVTINKGAGTQAISDEQTMAIIATAYTVDAVAPIITTNLTNKTTPQNTAVTLDATATVTDGGTVSYVWYSADDADKTNAAVIADETGATYAPPVDAVGTFFYYAVVTNTNASATGVKTAETTSAVATVEVEAIPTQEELNARVAIGNIFVNDVKAYKSSSQEKTFRILSYSAALDIDANNEEKVVNDTTLIRMELYKGETLLGWQEFNDTGRNKYGQASSFTGDIDVAGDYISTSWDHEWTGEITDIPDKAVAIVTYGDGTATVEKTLTFDEADTKIFFAAKGVYDLFVDAFVAEEELALAEGVDQAKVSAAQALVDAVTVKTDQNKVVLQGLITEAQTLLGVDGKVINTTQNKGYDTILEAINDATDGNTITVAEGTYTEAFNFRGNENDSYYAKPVKNLTLKAGGDVTIKNPNADNKTGFNIAKNMGTITIEGFKISDFQEPIAHGYSQSEGTTVHVLNNEIWADYDGIMRNGIQVAGNNSVVKGNTIHAEAFVGVWQSTAITVINAEDVLVEDNNMNNNVKIGISVNSYGGDLLAKNITLKNNVINSAQYGIQIQSQGTGRPFEVEGITIEENTITNNGSEDNQGISIYRVKLKNSTFKNNTIAEDFTYKIRVCSESTVENVKIDEEELVIANRVIIEGTPKVGETLKAKLEQEGVIGTNYSWKYNNGSWVQAQNSSSDTFVPTVVSSYYYVTVTVTDQYGIRNINSKTHGDGYTKVVKADGPSAPAVVGTETDANNEILAVGGKEKIIVTIGTNMNGEYEYSVNGGTDWTDLSTGEITGLTSATTSIQIREKATATTEAGAAATQAVTVTDAATEADTTRPVLAAGDVDRTSDTEATVKFTSDEAGQYYTAVVAKDEAAPTIDTSGAGTECTTSETTASVTLTAGAQNVYVVVKDAAGNVSEALKIAISEYTPN